MNVPMPNDRLDGAIVVASCLFSDEDHLAFDVWLAILLRPDVPFFEVVETEIRPDGPAIICSHGRFYNIVPAVASYEDNGGDY